MPAVTELPADKFGDVMKKVHTEWNPSMPLPTPVKFKEDQMSWRDDKGNSVLHIASWNGDIKLARALFDNVKGRKLVACINTLGATPLMMAIIGGQVIKHFRKQLLNA